jgi:excinuclease UvrABC ATPase subunit
VVRPEAALEVRYKGLNIADVLALTAEQAEAVIRP